MAKDRLMRSQLTLTNRKVFRGVLLLIFLSAVISCSSTKEAGDKNLIENAFSFAEQQCDVMIGEISGKRKTGEQKNNSNSTPVSPRTLKDGELVLVSSRDWTSGFFAGMLWFLYEYTGDNRWYEQAKAFTASIEQEQWNRTTHDMGFKIYCSVGNGYRLTGDTAYHRTIVQSAKTLCTRFKPVAGVLRSWDHNRDKWDCPVIIDNLMNLELLFAATRLTGDSTFYRIADSHARTTMRNHFREDNSSYHVIDYDTITGAVRKKNTHQGYSHESAWSRGQAWGLYGYTLCYRETGDSVFLTQAQRIARFILNHPRLPEDLIPYWDFDAPAVPNEPRDASAAAVIASALYELSAFTVQGNYKDKADEILQNLYTYYRADEGKSRGFILLHSTGSKPSGSEVDVPLIYADYYFLEALLRKKRLEELRD